MIDARLAPLARRAHAADVDALVALARGRLGANLRRQIVAALVPGETSFFRGPAAFEQLRTSALPALVAARRAERSLAVWCGAASTGQEAYSVAMLLLEEVDALRGWTLTLIASDLSAERLARARAGRYTAIEVNRGLPAAYAAKYFERDGPEWEVTGPVRALVTFREVNLHQPWPALPPLDVILLRNVLADFHPAARAQVLDRTRAALRPDGYAFLDADTIADGFEPVGDERAGCRRFAGAASAMA